MGIAAGTGVGPRNGDSECGDGGEATAQRRRGSALDGVSEFDDANSSLRCEAAFCIASAINKQRAEAGRRAGRPDGPRSRPVFLVAQTGSSGLRSLSGISARAWTLSLSGRSVKRVSRRYSTRTSTPSLVWI